MPEGDSLHRAARRLQVLVGETVEVESPNPRAAATGVAEQLDGRRLEGVEAVGKNLLLSFEGGLVLRSHLRMSGRWTVRARGSATRGRPWLVLRGRGREAVLWNGPVLELNKRAVRSLGPDILARPPDLDSDGREPPSSAATARSAMPFSTSVSSPGSGTCGRRRRSGEPGSPRGAPSEKRRRRELRAVLEQAARLMRRSVDTGREEREIYRKAGRPCPRCRTPIASRGQGDANRTAYWCPVCQPWERGAGRPGA